MTPPPDPTDSQPPPPPPPHPQVNGKHLDFTGGRPAIRRPGIEGDGQLANQGRVWAVGANFAFMVMGGGLLGWIIQRFWLTNASPWPLLVGLGAGMSAGMIQFIREAMKLNRKD